jgi:TonB family protein
MKNILHYLLIGILIGCSSVLKAQSDTNIDDKPVYGVEHMPQYPGGDEELLKFIHDNLRYPKVAAEVGIEGRVTIRFVISRTGEVTDVTVIRGLDPSCDREAVRVVKMMPTWTPGSQNGKNVAVYYTLPIVYKLQKSNGEVRTPLLVVDGKIWPYAALKDTNQLKPSNIKNITVLKDSAARAIYGENGNNGVLVIETKSGFNNWDTSQKLDKPIYDVDMMPQYPGGDAALLQFIKNNLHYPPADAERNVQGRVTLRFVIDKIGQVTDIAVIRGLSTACDQEAIRVVKLMPNWIPGKQNGRTVPVYYTLPIVYKLQR